MLTMTPFTVNPKAMHELIIMPQFADVLDDQGNVLEPSTEEGDWAVMDDVAVRRPILDLFGGQNILKRRDATCKLIYSPVGYMDARYIYTDKLYAATEDCIEEFYQGCFEDYDNGDFDIFFENVMPILEKGVATDLFTNRYFGDITRPADPTGVWSWNKFDGLFTKIGNYITAGTLPEDQTFAIPSGALTPDQAYSAFLAAWSTQDNILDNWDDDDKAFYSDKKLADALWDYYIQSGVTTLADRMSGRATLQFKGIDVKVKKWDSVLAALNGGTQAHALILTLKGNFLYATDSTYGGGPRRNEAIRIWWSDDDNVWKRQIHLKAGTELIAPQHMTFGLTSF